MTTNDQGLTPPALAMQLYEACLLQTTPAEASAKVMMFLIEALAFSISASTVNDEPLRVKTFAAVAEMIAKAPRHVLTLPVPKVGDRVKLVAAHPTDGGRIGTIVAPQPAIPGFEALAAEPEAASIYGKEGHVIVMLDAEAGQVSVAPYTTIARGGRGGKRICVRPDELESV